MEAKPTAPRRPGRRAALVGALAALALVALGAGAGARPAAAKGIGSMVSPAGIALPGSPLRYQTFSPGFPDELTVIVRIDGEQGRATRWWYLRGGYYVPAVAVDGTPGGLAADGHRLILIKHEARPQRAPRRTVLATIETDRPSRAAPGEPRDPFVRFARLRGEWALLAVSPDGRTAYLSRYRTGVDKIRPGLYRPHAPGTDRLEVRELDTASGRLLPGRVRDRDGHRDRLDGIPYAQAGSRDGRWTYTLYVGDRRRPFVYALDAATGHGTRIDLPRLRGVREPYALHLRLEDAERTLTVFHSHFPNGQEPRRTLARIDTVTFTVRGPQPRAYASAETTIAGRSAGGREIRLRQLGNPTLDGRLLVFGCIHGDECAARRLDPTLNGCPDLRSNLYLVPTLDPDGAALGTRLNGRGVDLNHNFPIGWRPIGASWDPQYAGPRPFSEPETRLAAAIVRQVEPRVTIWFHQHRGPRPFVRAWGAAIPSGRRFAALAGIPFLPLRWLAGTAPRWQNVRFPGTASFVVELPSGELRPSLEARLERAIVRLGREVGKD